MDREEREEQILDGLAEAVCNMDEKTVVELCEKVIEQGIDVHTAITSGLTEGMATAGQRYNEGHYFIPELILCSPWHFRTWRIVRTCAGTYSSSSSPASLATWCALRSLGNRNPCHMQGPDAGRIQA